jgi:hypothetical protein
MDSVRALAAARAEIPDRDLDGRRATIGGAPNGAPGLLAWLEHAVDWEIARRASRFHPRQGPRAAIDDTEVDGSLLTLTMLSDRLRHDEREGSETVADLLPLTAAVLRAEVERPDTRQ